MVNHGEPEPRPALDWQVARMVTGPLVVCQAPQVEVHQDQNLRKRGYEEELSPFHRPFDRPFPPETCHFGCAQPRSSPEAGSEAGTTLHAGPDSREG